MRRAALALLLCLAVFPHGCSRPGGESPAGGGEGNGPAAAAAGAPSPKAELLAIAERYRSGSNPYLGLAPMREIQSKLASAGLSAEERFNLLMKLAIEEIREGQTGQAVAHIEEAGRLLEGALPGIPEGAPRSRLLGNFHFVRGLVALRHADISNCVANHNADSCIFPIAGGGVHRDKAPARMAKESFERALELTPGELSARWLLNIAAMNLGEYPHGLAPQHRIPPSAFRSARDIGRFVDVAPLLGVDTFNLAGGVAVEDFDGDGFLDIVASTSDPAGPMTFHRNRGGGGFEDRSAASGLDQQLGGLNIVATDYDNDGDPDVLVLRGAWMMAEGCVRNSLLRNNGDGTFTDVTHEAGLADPAYPTQAAAWGDFDNDGDLDLYIGNETDAEDGVPYPAQLFRNNGDGTFTDIAERAGVRNGRLAKSVAAGDYDDDGDLDLYVSNIGPNRLYRNNGDGTFTDVAAEAGVAEPAGRSFAAWFFDFDNDGRLDLWVPAYDSTIADVAADYLGAPYAANVARLYRNEGNGTFTDVARRTGVARPYRPMGANFGDLDNDGFLDIYLGTGDPNLQSLMPNIMLRNDRGRRFEDVTTSGGFGHLQKGHGIGFADFDHDGDQDIYHQLGGFVPGDRFANALFLNPGHGGRFLVLQLVGVQSNRAAVGARIRVTVEAQGGRRSVHRAAGSVSSFGGSPLLRQHIGLGDARAIRELEVFWPRSGRRQAFTELPLDARIEIREDADAFRSLPYPRVPLLPEDAPGTGSKPGHEGHAHDPGGE